MDVSRHPGGADATASGIDAQIDLTVSESRPDLHDDQVRLTVERQLTRIPGVLAVRLVPGYAREVDELHVVTSVDRGAKSTVRDVQTVLLARCGVSIDHRVISVVHLDEQQVASPAARVRLQRVGMIRADNQLVAEVSLGLADREAHGTAEGVATTAGTATAVARATLAAFRSLLDTTLGIELREASLVTIAGHEIALVLLELRDERGEELRSGTAVVRDASADAIARSILDALNRTIDSPGT